MNTRSFQFAIAITIIWLVGIFAFYFLELFDHPTSFNELGDFLAGIFSPVAFFWLIYGYIQQGQQLEQNSRAIKLQAEALNLQIYEFKKLVAIQDKQNLDIKMSVKPKFVFK